MTKKPCLVISNPLDYSFLTARSDGFHLYMLNCTEFGRSLNHQTRLNMKSTTTVGSVLAVALIASALVGCATEKEKQTKLEAQAKINKADAQKIALAKVPGGKLTEGEIEKEKGKLIWSFDIATEGSKDITEVQVNALNGDVVSIEKESPTDEAKEKGQKEKTDKD